jgi:hypothetical protein
MPVLILFSLKNFKRIRNLKMKKADLYKLVEFKSQISYKEIKSQMDSNMQKLMVKKALLQKSNNKYQIDFDVYGEFARKPKRSWFY